MEKYPNLYGEFSAGSGANSIRRDLKFGREFILRRADEELLGDCPDFPAGKMGLSPSETLPTSALGE